MNFVIFIAHLFSIFRLPYAVVPYFLKFLLFAALRNSFSKFWNRHPIQVIRAVGEIFNLLITSWSLNIFFQDKVLLLMFLKLAFAAECMRLLCEKGIMGVNVFWQCLPHRSIARQLDKYQTRPFRHYVRYYILSDEKRIVRSLSILKASARLFKTPHTLEKLRYVNAFQIVSDEIPLRSGDVRNIARGEIYIHKKWLNSLDLLSGLALRRSPWIFDPRYLRRPFYYRSEANPLMTRFVLENASLCPLFSIYEFGHEIKAARYEVFYKLMRKLGVNVERPVCWDGTNNFDVLAKYVLQDHSNIKICHALYTDEQVLLDLAGNPLPAAEQIAEKYTYPLAYVQEVLIQKLKNES